MGLLREVYGCPAAFSRRRRRRRPSSRRCLPSFGGGGHDDGRGRDETRRTLHSEMILSGPDDRHRRRRRQRREGGEQLAGSGQMEKEGRAGEARPRGRVRQTDRESVFLVLSGDFFTTALFSHCSCPSFLLGLLSSSSDRPKNGLHLYALSFLLRDRHDDELHILQVARSTVHTIADIYFCHL